MLRVWVPLLFLAGSVIVPLSGCGREPAPDKGLARVGTAAVPVQFAPARRVFETSCAKCHTIGPKSETPGDKPPPKVAAKDKGPDLAKIGADPSHTRQWIIDYVRDPQSQNPKSRMPKFAGKLGDDAIAALADYLVTLK